MPDDRVMVFRWQGADALNRMGKRGRAWQARGRGRDKAGSYITWCDKSRGVGGLPVCMSDERYPVVGSDSVEESVNGDGGMW